MRRRHTKDEILAAALAAAMDEGLSRLTFGRLAKRLGTNDRTVVYYFPTKDNLITEVVTSLGLELQKTVGAAFSQPASDHLDLAAKAWPIMAKPENDPVFALFFEAVGLAATGRQPYDQLVPALIEDWTKWSTALLTGPESQRRAEAEAAIALIDGLLLVRQIAGPDTADRAARALEVR
jgi:AcrR family transcriptional regulator